jgi:hypothetical protein
MVRVLIFGRGRRLMFNGVLAGMLGTAGWGFLGDEGESEAHKLRLWIEGQDYIILRG